MAVFAEALRLAQIDEGMMGDNTVFFTPDDSSDNSYNSAVKLSKYLNTVKVCKNVRDDNCTDLYYPVKTAIKEYNNGVHNSTTLPKIVLTDGSIFTVLQYEKCEDSVPTCQKDQYGNCQKDENGNTIYGGTWNKQNCAYVYLDVNGAQGPNKFGRDNFLINVNRDKFFLNTADWTGGDNGKNIMLNKE